MADIERNRHNRLDRIRRGGRRTMEKGGTAPADTKPAGAYYAVALLAGTADPFIELSILPQRICGLCGYLPLLARGICPCQMVHICSSYTPDE